MSTRGGLFVLAFLALSVVYQVVMSTSAKSCDCANVSRAIIRYQDARFRALRECKHVARGGRMGGRVDGVEL